MGEFHSPVKAKRSRSTKIVDHHAITIRHLPNELLLHIFFFHRLLSGTNNRPPSVAWKWHTLAHVCQRWRELIFTSLRHLEAHLVIPRKSPETPLDSWPALPLSVWCDSSYFNLSEEEKADIVAAFKYSDRIREIHLPMAIGYSFWTSIRNKSFPELEHLALSGIPGYPVPLSHEFLGGATSSPRRLRSIFLSYIHLPSLPQLLFSSRDLVSLHLGYYTLTHHGFISISPEDLSTALSATTKLEYLYIHCVPGFVASPPELRSANSSPFILTVLPALTYFHFGGFIKYMEDFLSRIHAPHLVTLNIHSHEDVMGVPQLSQFISRTEQLNSVPFQTSISFGMEHFSIDHHFRRLPSPRELSRVYFKNVYMGDLQVSRVDHICRQLSLLASSVKQLKLSAFRLPSNLQRKTDPAPWLQLLAPYNSVEEIEICGKGGPCTGFAWALRQSTRETAQELLPALRVLRIRGFHSRSIRLTLMSFAAARRRAGRPVIMGRLERTDQDAKWEINDDTCEL